MIKFSLKIIDVFFCILVSIFFVFFIFFLKFNVKNFDKKFSNILSLSRDSVKLTKQLNSRNFLNDFYGHPGFKMTYVVNFNSDDNSLVTLGRNIVGIDLLINLNYLILNKLIFSKFIIFEIISLFKTIKFMKKTSSGVIELVTPGPLEPKAVIIKFITNCKIMSQVRGNVDLLSHSIDKYFYFRISRKILIFRLISFFIHKFLSEIFYSNCDLVIGYNKNNLDSAISNGADPKISRLLRIEIHKPNNQLETNSSISLGDFPSSGKIILIWSRLSEEKLIDESIKGFLLAADIIDDLSLVIIGSGPYQEKLETLVNLSNHSKRVHFLGYKNRDYISKAAKKSLCLVLEVLMKA